jgi:hypothetical protein
MFTGLDSLDALNFSIYLYPTGEYFLIFVSFLPRIADLLAWIHDTFHDQPCINPNQEAFRLKVFSIAPIRSGTRADLSQKAPDWCPNADGLQRQAHH